MEKKMSKIGENSVQIKGKILRTFGMKINLLEQIKYNAEEMIENQKALLKKKDKEILKLQQKLIEKEKKIEELQKTDRIHFHS